MKLIIRAILVFLMVWAMPLTTFSQGKISVPTQTAPTHKQSKHQAKPKNKHSQVKSDYNKPQKPSLEDCPFFIVAGNASRVDCYSRTAWILLPDYKKQEYSHLGVVVPGGESAHYNGWGGTRQQPFIIYHNHITEASTWDEAMKMVGSHLPTVPQARLINRHRSEINKSLRLISYSTVFPESGFYPHYWTDSYYGGNPIVFIPGEKVIKDVSSDTTAYCCVLWPSDIPITSVIL